MLRTCTDVDGVKIRNRTEDFFRFLTEQGITCDKWSYYRHNCWQLATGLDNRQVSVQYRLFETSPSFPPSCSVAGAYDGLRALQNVSTLHVVTARPVDISEETEKELNRLFPRVQFESFHYNGWDRKHELVRECRGQTLIEDNIRLALQVVQKTTATVIVMPQPENVLIPRHDHERLIYPWDQAQITQDMQDEEWDRLLEKVWKQIPELVITHVSRRRMFSVF